MEKQKKYATNFLFSPSSLLSGAGTVVNLAGNFYEFNYFETGIEADERAIGNDFLMIGQDIFDVIEKTKVDKRKLVLSK